MADFTSSDTGVPTILQVNQILKEQIKEATSTMEILARAFSAKVIIGADLFAVYRALKIEVDFPADGQPTIQDLAYRFTTSSAYLWKVSTKSDSMEAERKNLSIFMDALSKGLMAYTDSLQDRLIRTMLKRFPFEDITRISATSKYDITTEGSKISFPDSNYVPISMGSTASPAVATSMNKTKSDFLTEFILNSESGMYTNSTIEIGTETINALAIVPLTYKQMEDLKLSYYNSFSASNSVRQLDFMNNLDYLKINQVIYMIVPDDYLAHFSYTNSSSDTAYGTFNPVLPLAESSRACFHVGRLNYKYSQGGMGFPLSSDLETYFFESQLPVRGAMPFGEHIKVLVLETTKKKFDAVIAKEKPVKNSVARAIKPYASAVENLSSSKSFLD